MQVASTTTKANPYVSFLFCCSDVLLSIATLNGPTVVTDIIDALGGIISWQSVESSLFALSCIASEVGKKDGEEKYCIAVFLKPRPSLHLCNSPKPNNGPTVDFPQVIPRPPRRHEEVTSAFFQIDEEVHNALMSTFALAFAEEVRAKRRMSVCS